VDDAIEEALLGVVGPGAVAASMLQPNKLRIDEIRCARLLAAILKRRAMPLTALSGNMTLPTLPTGWSPANLRHAGIRRLLASRRREQDCRA